MVEKKKTIYLDNAATTKIDPLVLRAMLLYLKENYGNPSSIHLIGQKTRVAIEKARKQVSLFLNCQENEVYFTPSATFSDNLAIFGIVNSVLRKGIKPHIITSEIEHPAVLEPIKHLVATNQAEATFLPVSKDGLVSPDDFKTALKENTCLVSIMIANNEIGTIQPIAKIGEIIRNFRNSKSETLNSKQVPLFHTDAVQGANYLDLDVNKLGVDLLTISGHKIYGPKGIGVLYVKQGIKIEPLLYGGHQELGLIPGTENVANIVGLGKAVEQIKNQKSKIKNIKQRLRIEELRDKLIDRVLASIPKAYLNGSREKRLPNNVNISFKGIEGEALLIMLDRAGVCVSTGSACSSGNLEPSHVLTALGINKERSHSAIRFSLSKFTTEKEIDYVLKVLPGMVSHLRKIAGFGLEN